MKILHLLSQRPDSTGSGIYLQAMLEQGALAGHENYLVAGVPAFDIPEVKSIPDRNCSFVLFETREYPERIVGMSDVMPYPSRQFRQLSEQDIERYLEQFERAVQEAVQKFQPDVLHVNHLWLLASLTRTMFPERIVIASSHGSELRQFHQCSHLRERVLSGCRKLDAVCALSQDQRSEIHSLYSIPLERIQVSGAGFDTALFYPEPEPVPKSPPTFLYGGKLSRAKGVPWLLRSLANLEGYDFHLHLAGSGAGPEFSECMSLCERLGDKLTYHGPVSQLELASLMHRSCCFVLPSLHEGLPLVILEALACGCRVISTDLPGAREIVSYLPAAPISLVKTPVVTDIDTSCLENETSFTAALETELRDHLSGKCRKPPPSLSLDHFTWQQVFRRVEDVWLACASART